MLEVKVLLIPPDEQGNLKVEQGNTIIWINGVPWRLKVQSSNRKATV